MQLDCRMYLEEEPPTFKACVPIHWAIERVDNRVIVAGGQPGLPRDYQRGRLSRAAFAA